MFRSQDLRVYPYFEEKEYEVNNAQCTATRVQIPIDYTRDELSEVHCSIRYNYGDALGSETGYRSTMSTIATSRKTTPSHVQQEEIAYDLSQRA